jgi:VWFA-related protein
MRIARWTASLTLIAALPVLAQGPPRFETDVDLVAVDAFAVDADGKPVSDLKPGEFTVKVDGKPRSVVSVRFVETVPPAADPPSTAEAPAPAPAAPPPVAPREGRRVVIVIDRDELGAGAAQNAVEAASRFIEELGPADRAALFSIPSGPRMDFTSDKAALLGAIAKVGPARQPFISEFTIDLTEALMHVQAPARSPVGTRECSQYSKWGRQGQRGGDPTDLTTTGEEENVEMVQCAQRVYMEARRQVEEHQRSVEARLYALEAICQALALVPGPKVLALVSGGFTSVMQVGGPDVINRMRAIADAAAAARITFYAIYLSQRHEVTSAERSREYRTREQDHQLRAEGLETLTGMNGGHLYEVMASAKGAFTRLARETSGYYLLGLEPEKRDRDGKPHDIDVKVLRAGVDVRARKRFVLTGGPTMARRGPAPLFTPPPPAAPRSPVRLATHVLRGGPAGSVKVLVGAEVHGFSAGRLALSVLDVKGGVVGNTSEDLTVAAGRAPRYQDTLVLPRGPYVLKAEAVDAGGRREVTDVALNAELLHGVGFDASDLLLFEEGETGRQLSATGTVHGQVLRPYLELYVQEGLPTEDLSVSLDILGADGKRRLAGVLSVRQGGEPGLLFAEGRIEIGALPPGRYTARAIIMFGTKVSRHVERSFERAPAQTTSR